LRLHKIITALRGIVRCAEKIFGGGGGAREFRLARWRAAIFPAAAAAAEFGG